MGECCRNNCTIVIFQQPSRHWESLNRASPIMAHASGDTQTTAKYCAGKSQELLLPQGL